MLQVDDLSGNQSVDTKETTVGQGNNGINHDRKSEPCEPISEEWPDPKPVRCDLLPVEPLPLSIIPKPYQPWLQDISHRMQCPIDFTAVSALVMTGGVIGAGCGISALIIPVGLITLLLLWVTGNNRVITGIVVGILGLMTVGKIIAETKSGFGR